MKKLLWTSTMALAAAACLTACDDSSSSSYEIPTYQSDTSLPGTCSMEVAKVDTAYFACFENKWIEVTDSATIEQLKEGLDEEEIKAKLEELQSLLPKPADNTPKPTSSSAQGEVEGSDNEGDSSSSSEEEESSSSSKKKKDKDKEDSGSGEGGSGEGGETTKKCGGVTYDPETQVCGEGETILDKCGEETVNPKTQYCKDGTTPTDLPKCGTATDAPKYNPNTQYCRERDFTLIDLKNREVCCFGGTKCRENTNYYDITKEICDVNGTLAGSDGNVYKIVTISDGEDTQTWMAENLRLKTDNAIYFRGNATYSDRGYFYPINDVLENACPAGWHLPTIEEWDLALKINKGEVGKNNRAKTLVDALSIGNYGYYSHNSWLDEGAAFWANSKKDGKYLTPYVDLNYMNYRNDATEYISLRDPDLNPVRCIKDASAE